ncbi:MAG: hypothetical protein ABJQ71_13105 [Roseibium sp.]
MSKSRQRGVTILSEQILAGFGGADERSDIMRVSDINSAAD